jgi:hypothetical protein
MGLSLSMADDLTKTGGGLRGFRANNVELDALPMLSPLFCGILSERLVLSCFFFAFCTLMTLCLLIWGMIVIVLNRSNARGLLLEKLFQR